MQLELATVISCGAAGCRVIPVSGGTAFETNYSASVLGRIKIRPGQLVAVDTQPGVPEVAWRWYRARVIASDERTVTVQERDRQLAVARVAGLETAANPDDEIWVTGMEAGWELHDQVVDDKPADPTRLCEKVIPRIATLLSNSG
jgi:hypothetical protein